MERLTFEGNFCDITQCAEIPGGSFCEDGACSQRKVWERLKQYEDTGLEPKQCANAKALVEMAFDNDTDKVEHIAELMRADKEGRVVVLPLKEGDAVQFGAWFGIEPPSEEAELRKSAEYHESRRLGYYSAIDHINEQPTVDAVEVVRCSKCRYADAYERMDGKTEYYCLHKHNSFTYGQTLNRVFNPIKDADDFCSYGERRANNG